MLDSLPEIGVPPTPANANPPYNAANFGTWPGSGTVGPRAILSWRHRH